MSSDLNEPEPLTPSHLLCGRRLTCLPYPQKDIKNIYDTEPYTHINLNRHLQIQCDIIKKFGTSWKNEYLTSLREYHRTLGKNTQNIKVSDVVQIHDDSPRITWKLAVVDELIFGATPNYTEHIRLRTVEVRCSGRVVMSCSKSISHITNPVSIHYVFYK